MTSFGEVIDHLQESGRLRELKPLAKRKGALVEFNGRTMLNLSSNDYLGLAGSSQLHQDFYNDLDGENILERYCLGAASSRLLSGDSHVLHQFEEEVAAAYGAESALFFNSGYHANIGILPALAGKRDLIVSDKLNHASIHDGLRLSAATHRRYRHCDYSHLEAILEKHRKSFDRVFIVTESVFSMDGDVADLQKLSHLRDRYDCLLYVDEAHAIGLYGDNGLGKAEEQGVLDQVDLLICPLGKAFGSVGCFIICNSDIRQFLINHSRSLIFTTALPPVVINWNLFVLRRILGMAEERAHLLDLHQMLRRDLVECGLKTDGNTNIVPVLIGDNRQAVQAAAMMQERGYLVFPVRPPTVPEGTARFRLSLTADMKWTDLENVAATIASCLA